MNKTSIQQTPSKGKSAAWKPQRFWSQKLLDAYDHSGAIWLEQIQHSYIYLQRWAAYEDLAPRVQKGLRKDAAEGDHERCEENALHAVIELVFGKANDLKLMVELSHLVDPDRVDACVAEIRKAAEPFLDKACENHRRVREELWVLWLVTDKPRKGEASFKGTLVDQNGERVAGREWVWEQQELALCHV